MKRFNWASKFLKMSYAIITCMLFMQNSCGDNEAIETPAENSIEGPWNLSTATVSPPKSSGETNLWKPQNASFDQIRFKTIIDFKKGGKIDFTVPGNGDVGTYQDIVRDAGPGINFFCNPNSDRTVFFPTWTVLGDSVEICSEKYHYQVLNGKMTWTYSYENTVTIWPPVSEHRTVTIGFTRP